jgi:TDG/mug DNA glycosylase family protein
VFGRRQGQSVALGLQEERLEGARVFVLPNPSGRNANFSYGEMLEAFVELRRALEGR